MLRLLVLLLLLANGLYFAFTQGALREWGFAPTQQAEPQRMGQQVRRESIRLLGADEARGLETAAAAQQRSPDCLQAGMFEEAQVAALRPALESLLPAGGWTLEPSVEPARWIVYMGRYPGTDAVNRKRAELRQLGISFENLANPALEPGLSLGGFASQAAATQYLDTLAQRGVRTARVLQERDELRGQVLRLPAVDEVVRARLDDIRALLGGKGLRACR